MWPLLRLRHLLWHGLWLGPSLSACAPAADPTPGTPVRRVALAPAESATLDAEEERVVATLEVPEELAPWIVEPPAQSRVLRPMDGPDRGESRAVGVQRAVERVTIRIPGPFEPRTFDRIAVRLLGNGLVHAQIELVGAIGKPVQSEILRVEGSDTARTMVFDIPALQGMERTFDELHLVLREPQGGWFVGAIDLIDRPLRHWLPLVEDGPELVQIGPEARRAQGLSNRMPLVGDFEIRPGDRLSLTFGLPQRVAHRRARGHVHVSASANGRSLFEHRLEIDASFSWHRKEIELARLTDHRGSARLRFELRTHGPEEALVALASPQLHAPSSAPPTVLLVTSDTHRADHVSAYGWETPARTPALDALAARGRLFTNCFSSSNVTVPSHIALLTGTHPRDTTILINHARLAPQARTLSEAFRRAGWVTWAVTSNRNLGRVETGVTQGFDRAAFPYTTAARRGDRTVDQLLEWLPEAQGRPLFVWLHVFDAHGPYTPPAPFDLTHWPAGRDARDPELPEPTWPVPDNWAGVRDPEWIRAQYAGEVGYLDSQLARVIDHARFERATIAVTADHGESLGQHGVWWDHGGLYPDNVHVPLILVTPDEPAVSRVDDPVRQMDLGRTLLDLASVDAEFPGHSLVQPSDADGPRFCIAQSRAMASMSVDPWYLLLGLKDNKGRLVGRDPGLQYGEIRLYHLGRDPRCTENLLQAEFERARAMRSALLDWLTNAQPADWFDEVSDDAETLAELAELGYVTGVGSPDFEPYYDPERDGWSTRFE